MSIQSSSIEEILLSRKFFIFLLSLLIFSSLSSFFVAQDGYAEFLSLEPPCTVGLNETFTVVGEFLYAFSSLDLVSVRVSEAKYMPMEPEDPFLAYEEFLVQGEGIQEFNLSIAAPSTEVEWDLVATLWVPVIGEWSLMDEYEFNVTVTMPEIQIGVEIVDLSLSSLEPVAGETITITAELAVTGFTPDQELSIQFYIDDEIAHEETVLLPAMETYTDTISFEWEAEEGSHTIAVEAEGEEKEIVIDVSEAPPPPPTPPSEIPTWALIGGIAAIATIGFLLLPRLIYKKRPECEVGHKWMFHDMNLRVYPTGFKELRTLADDPLPLKATASDRHVLIQECACLESGSTKNHVLYANVRIEWEIISGEGGFIKINEDKLSKKDVGEQVLYQPPDIESLKETKRVTFKITAHHDDETKPPKHDPCVITWELEIRREVKESGKSSENNKEFKDPGEVTDELVYIQKSRKKKCPARKPLPKEKNGECLPEHVWKPGTPIDGKITLSQAEVAIGDYVVLQATGTDKDELQLKCKPSGETCTRGSEKEISLNDVLLYRWEASKGRFPLGSGGSDIDSPGREVIWQAPDKEGKVKIKLKIFDPMVFNEQFDDKEDKDIELEIKVCKLGIDLVETPKTWNTTSNLKLSDLTLELPARIYICKDKKWKYPGRKKLIRFKLKGVSREKGVCMNYPKNGNTNPDLFFYEEKMKDEYLFLRDKTVSKDCPTEVVVANDNPAHDRHYLYSVSKKKKAEAKTTIRCEDYGAIGFLEAKANHCVQIPARETEKADPCPNFPGCCYGSNKVKIPRDADNNDIADKAPQNENGKSPFKDEDETPAGEGTKGDGLTNYEEYRGFIVGGKKTFTFKTPVPTVTGFKLVETKISKGSPKRHVRTNTKKKDVFVYDQDFLGTGYLNQSGLTIHRIFLEDLFNGTAKRVINFNRGRHTGGEQHGLWLRNHALGGPQGRACGGPNGPPKNKTHICVDVATCTAPGEPATTLDCVIAHELGHGSNCFHHGETGNHNTCGIHTNRAGGLTSGVHICVMRYDQYALAWCHDTPHCRHQYVGDKPGTIFCTSKNGSGFNNKGAGHRNDATRGDCKGQIKVKDW